MLRSTRALALAAAILSVTALAGCSTTKTLSTDDVQNAIQKGLSDQVGGTFTVTCPSDITAEKGGTFTCSVANASDGSTATVTVTQEDAEGQFNWKVTAASSGSPAPAATPAAS